MTAKLKKRKTKQQKSFLRKARPFIITFLAILLITAVGFHYRNGLAYYLGFKSDKILKENAEKQRIYDVRNFQILTKFEFNPIGIDVSEYQGKIIWDSVRVIENRFPIRFVFLRATVGIDRVDKRFDENWNALDKTSFIRGAYHYYRPNENSTDQAQLFIKTVQLKKGDLPPVLDIEQMPTKQTMIQLKVGIQKWLDLVEAHYGIKPIIYSGENFYTQFLKDDFPDYVFWVANYNFFVENMQSDWRFWQFTEKGTIGGISGPVDVNIFNGTEVELTTITLKK